MKVEITTPFLTDLFSLAGAQQKKCITQIKRIQEISARHLFSNQLPQGWHVEKLQKSDLWSLRVNLNYRMILAIRGDTLTLHRVGNHEEAYSSLQKQQHADRTIPLSSDLPPGSLRNRTAGSPPDDERFATTNHSIVPNLSLGKIVEAAQLSFLLLDEEQLQCINDFLIHNPRALVSGEPGTGKTLIAAEAAKRLCNEGNSVLLVCFTEALAHWLRSGVGNDKVAIWPVKRLAIHLLQLVGRDIHVPGRREDWTPEFWQSVVPAALKNAGALIDTLEYNTIIVDEGRDLDSNDWQLIERLSSGCRSLWVFSDPSQKLWPDRAMPDLNFAKYRLRKQYRSSPEIQALASFYRSETVGRPASAELEGLPEYARDQRIKIVRCENRAIVPHEVAVEIDRLTSQGVHPEDIAIISLVSRTDRSALGGLDVLEGRTLVRADDPRFNEEIVAESVYRFKGLERPAVILTDLSLRASESESIRRAKMNVAITRAQSFLRIVDTSEAISREPELGVLPG